MKVHSSVFLPDTGGGCSRKGVGGTSKADTGYRPQWMIRERRQVREARTAWMDIEAEKKVEHRTRPVEFWNQKETHSTRSWK